MATADIDPVVARIANRIGTIANIGLIHLEDPFDRDDLRPYVVSTIAGTPTLRAWWVSGPTMASKRIVQANAGPIERAWTYTVYGVEGLVAGNDPQQTLRRNALAVCDALDLDRDLGGTVQRADLCQWQLLDNRPGWRGIAVSFVEIRKTVTTLSAPT